MIGVAGGLVGVAALMFSPLTLASLGLLVASAGTKIGSWLYNKDDNSLLDNYDINKAE